LPAARRCAGAPRAIGGPRLATPRPTGRSAWHSPATFSGTNNARALAELSRETPSSTQCGSNVRFRAIAYLVTYELLGKAAPLPTLPAHREITGIGLSDAHAYAEALARIFGYENTYYHTDPRLDIGRIADDRVGRYDFVIASDVFEHVTPPVGRAFVNARRLLKPGGKFIFTVPFTLEAATREHYPALHDWSMAEHDGQWTLTNRTVDGRVETFGDLVFHGGPGSTLEMRLFSRAALEEEFRNAGFARVRIADEPYLPYGIHWPEPWSVPMVAYAP
jgi:SAM-dependent methyltransferase